jgi:GalNAc-alpha-(1->4)-GalNAc-alpha-(1->3)-diNAcBac-PP-undecaprenol alpha-1,4-N-acetyl-D-galactosaminyltransferase
MKTKPAEEVKILLLTGSLNQGGAEFQILSLAKLLQERGLCVEVLAVTDYNYYLPFVQTYNLEYSCVSNSGNNLQRLGRAVKTIISKRPDIVISYLKRVSQVAILARILSAFSFKLIISERTAEIKKWHDLYYFNLALLADFITVNSPVKAEYIRKRFPLLKNKVVHVVNILDLDRFIHLVQGVRSDSGLKITYIGRISPEKNLVNILKAVKALSDSGIKVEFKMFGAATNNEYFLNLKSEIDNLHLAETAQYCGTTNDLESVYTESDIIALMSFYEGFSNVLAEAAASGVAVVASNIDENRIIVENGVTGFLADPYNPDDIAAAFKKYLGLDEVQKRIMKENARKLALSVFNNDEIFRAYYDMFRRKLPERF